jgi:hypothetical protein
MTQPVFKCYGVVDKDDELFLEKDSFSDLASTAVGTAEMLNITARLTGNDERAPYQPVEIYIKKVN